MRIVIALLSSLAAWQVASGADPVAVAAQSGVVVRAGLPAAIPQGPQMFIDDTNTAIVLAPVQEEILEPAPAHSVPPTEFDRSRLGTTEETRGIGNGQQGSGIPIDPLSSEPTGGLETSEQQIGEPGEPAILPGLSDQGLVFPEPSTIIVGPQFDPRTVPGLGPDGLVTAPGPSLSHLSLNPLRTTRNGRILSRQSGMAPSASFAAPSGGRR